jgi:5'-3' exonuclease
MGIKNFNKFLREKSPNVFEKIHLSEYAYKKVAIDISLYLFKFKAVCGDRWITAFINLISTLRRNNVHCIFVYDGKSPPEKDDEKAKRRNEKEKLQENVYKLNDALDNYHRTGVVENILQNLYKNRKKTISSHKRLLVEEEIDMRWIETKIEQKNKQLININATDFDCTKKLFDILGVPYCTAPAEAEKLCSKLCIDGLVDGVMSDDTDVIAYGTPVFLTKIDTFGDTCIRISGESLLSELKLDRSELLDFCIMCGTDYNNNIYKVGVHTSYKHILSYKTIENMEQNTDLDISVLNHVRVRELFTKFDDYDLTYVPYCSRPQFILLDKFSEEHNLDIDMENIKKNFTYEPIFESSDNEKMDEDEDCDDDNEKYEN